MSCVSAAGFECLVPLADQLHFLGRCSIDDPEVVRRYQEQVDGLRSLVARLREQGHLDPSVPDSSAVALANSLIWTSWSAAASGSVPGREAAALATRTFLRGLGPGVET